MDKLPLEGNSPESSQPTIERFGQWISQQGESVSRSLEKVAGVIGTKINKAVKTINSGWASPVSGRGLRRLALPAALAGGLAISSAAKADYLFTETYTEPVLVDLSDGSETPISGLHPTSYGLSRSGFYDESTGKLVLAYRDEALHSSSEGIFVVDDVTGTPSLSITSGLDEDPGKINRNPNTGSVAFSDDTGARLCTDYEDSSSCDTYTAYAEADEFEADEAGTGRGVIVDPSGYDVIDLATGVSELSGSLSYGAGVAIDRDNGYAFILDVMGMDLITVDLNAATPTVVGTETFSVAPIDLLLYTNVNTGNKELAVIGYYTTTGLEIFEVSGGGTLTSVGSDSYASTLTMERDILAVDDISNANYLYVGISMASSIKRVDLSSYTFDGASYGPFGAMVVYIPSATPCTDADSDGACATDDCDDSDGSVQTEQNYYVDGDGDGYGAGSAVPICSASAPSGYSTIDTDCDDGDASVHGENPFAVDSDGDGYGDPSNIENLCSTAAPSGYTSMALATDCDDANASAYPGSPYEVSCWWDAADNEDLNCDTVYPDECEHDADGDGWEAEAYGGIDCNDGDAFIYPGANEHCDGVDENCDLVVDDNPVDGAFYCYDGDSDGYPTADCIWACGPDGYYTVLSGVAEDYDDTDSNTFPGASEISDGKDNDGDDLIDECLWAEGSDWTPAAACTHMDVYAGAEIDAWATEGGFYTIEIISDYEEMIVTFHGVEGEIEAVRGEGDIAFFTGPEGGGSAWICGSIGRMGWEGGIATFTIVDEGDTATHYGVIESQADEIEREDSVRVLEGEVVAMNATTGEINKEETTAGEVLEALEEDTGDDDTGDDDTGGPDDDTADTTPEQPDDTGDGNGGGCNECSTTGNAEAPDAANSIALLALLGLTGLRRRGSRIEASLSTGVDEIRNALAKALKSLVG